MHEERVQELKQDSLPDLLRQLSMETTTLVRQEIDLAKLELVEKGKTVGTGAGLLAGAAVVGLAAFGALTAFLIAAIAIVLQLWAAALIVAVIYTIVALVIAQLGRTKLLQAAPVVPQETAQSVKEDVEWVKMRAQSGKK